MDYEKLTLDQQEQMLDQRLAQYEQEHFNHSVNLKLLEDSGADDPATAEAKRAAQAAMETLDKAHAQAKAERNKIKATAKKAK